MSYHNRDLKETMSAMKQIEEEKAKLHEQAKALESNLEVRASPACTLNILHL